MVPDSLVFVKIVTHTVTRKHIFPLHQNSAFAWCVCMSFRILRCLSNKILYCPFANTEVPFKDLSHNVGFSVQRDSSKQFYHLFRLAWSELAQTSTDWVQFLIVQSVKCYCLHVVNCLKTYISVWFSQSVFLLDREHLKSTQTGSVCVDRGLL